MTAKIFLMAFVVSTFGVVTNAHASKETETSFKAEGQFTGNRDASYVMRFMMETTPNYGDSNIAVDTEVKIDGRNSTASISVTSVTDPAAPDRANIKIRLSCQKFSVTDQRETLFMSKAQEATERNVAKGGQAYRNGDVSRNNVFRADCLNKKGEKFNAMMMYDETSYTLVLNDGTLANANPRFDVIIGPILKK